MHSYRTLGRVQRSRPGVGVLYVRFIRGPPSLRNNEIPPKRNQVQVLLDPLSPRAAPPRARACAGRREGLAG